MYDRTKEKPIDKHIDDIGISPRCFNCLMRVGIQFLSDIKDYKFDDLIKIHNLGFKCACEIIYELYRYGFIEHINVTYDKCTD